MTRILVAYASKMGGTEAIAIAIGEELRRAGLDAHVHNARDVKNTDGFDAAVIGSAVYTGRWRPEAVALLARQADQPRPIPTWLFQSGPCGPDARTTQLAAPKRVRGLAGRVGAAAPVTFGGRIQSGTEQGALARRMSRGPTAGDFRDFDRIRRWANEIATALFCRSTRRDVASIARITHPPWGSRRRLGGGLSAMGDVWLTRRVDGPAAELRSSAVSEEPVAALTFRLL